MGKVHHCWYNRGEACFSKAGYEDSVLAIGPEVQSYMMKYSGMPPVF
jgi:hypothetical protein